MRALWEKLVSLPHRGTGSDREREAAEILTGHLRHAGYEPEVQAFAAPASWGPEVLFISLLLGVGALFGLWWLALLGCLAFWAYFSGWPRPWERLFARARSQNVLASAGAGERALVLMAHYDSAKTYFVYDPRRVRGFRANFLLNAALALLAPLAAWWGGWAGWLLGAYFLVQAALLAWRELSAPYVNGANDNASGVAVATQLFLDLAAEPPPGWRLLLALTGAEETGANGAAALLRSGRLPADALVLNIDNVGKGKLFYAVGEGMLGFTRYRGPLLGVAEKLTGARPLVYRLAYFDTWPLARRGLAVLTLITLENGVPANWHWPSDVAENVDWKTVEQTYQWSRRLLSDVLGLPENGGTEAGI